MQEKGYKYHLTCSKETRDFILKNGMRIFMRRKVYVSGMKVTHNILLKDMFKVYASVPYWITSNEDIAHYLNGNKR